MRYGTMMGNLGSKGCCTTGASRRLGPKDDKDPMFLGKRIMKVLYTKGCGGSGAPYGAR